MYNKNIQDTKLFIIEVSNFCVNKCEGCIYSLEDRKKNIFINNEDFTKIINFIKNYCNENNLIPHILIGTGETIVKEIFDYIDIIEKSFEKKIVELATTGKLPNFKENIENIEKKLTNTRLIIEFVLDGFQNKENIKNNIKNNIKYVNDKNLEIHTVLKTTDSYQENIINIVNNIKDFNLKYITLDYTFLKSMNKLMSLEDISEYFFKFNEEIKKENIKLINYLEDYKNNEIYQFSNFGFYINKNGKMDIRLEVPFGDLIINQENSNFDLNINIFENNDTFNYKRLKINEIKIYNKNKLLSKKIELCSKCQNNKNCSIFLVEKLMEKHKLKLEKDCLGGKKILDYFRKNIIDF